MKFFPLPASAIIALMLINPLPTMLLASISPVGFGASTEYDLAVAPAGQPLDQMVKNFDGLYALNKVLESKLTPWNRDGRAPESKEINTIAVGFCANTGYYTAPGAYLREGMVSRDIDFGITYRDLQPDGSLTVVVEVNDTRATPKAADNKFKVETKLAPGAFRMVRLGPPQGGEQAWLALRVKGVDRSIKALPVTELNFDHAQPVDLQFTAVDGRHVNTTHLRDKVILVDFWATWCGPCIATLPTLEDLYDRYHPQGLEVIGVSLDGDRGRLDGFLKAHPHPWPQYFFSSSTENMANPLAQRFGVNGIPAFILINKKGLGTTIDIRNPDTDDRIKAAFQ